jgi:adenylosuccinate lyase
MIERYSDPKIKEIWDNPNKLRLWQQTELAVIQARCNLSLFPPMVGSQIKEILENTSIDISWWLARDKEIHHDLNAFLDERLKNLPSELHQYFHEGMTSYDTEEPSMSLMLLDSVKIIETAGLEIMGVLAPMIEKYKATPMMARTHGQEAKLQSFGKRIFTWYKKLQISFDELTKAKELICYSKLSGAIGNYQGLSAKEEFEALKILGLKPFKGATQIMPRQLHQPLVNALVMIIGSLSQIAEDIRLGARSGNPIFQEPFAKKQKGSSAMPHKKNTITLENQVGMFILAKGFAQMLRDVMITWEERSIEQSAVERIAWPDLFHVVMNSYKNMGKVLKDLQVYPENMLKEIENSKGCYASEDAKDWLKQKGSQFGLKHEDAYRIVQLAAFNAHWLKGVNESIKDLISQAKLQPMPDNLDAGAEDVNFWREKLKEIFSVPANQKSWAQIFDIEYHLRNENYLFEELKQK